MSEWWTYSLSDLLPFSARTYYRLFELYNTAIWPGQIVAVLMGLVILVLLRRSGPAQCRAIAAILAACWLWVAWAFLFERYASINWAAPYFAAAFAIEALLLGLVGVAGGWLSFRPVARWPAWTGVGLLVFALVIQPLIGPLLGRAPSQMEVFGVAPDPTVVATLGLLALAAHWSKWALLAIPTLWSVISGATAWTMGSADAVIMPLVAAVAIGAASLSSAGRSSTA